MARTADQLLRELEARERQLGAEHPDTLTTVDSLAGLLHAQGKLAEAERLCRRALEGYEQQLGAHHLSTLLSVNNLASLLQVQGKLTKAERLCRRALEGCEQQLGAQHPDTLCSVSNLARLLQAQGRAAEAEPLFRRCAGSREMAAARCLGCGTQHNAHAQKVRQVPRGPVLQQRVHRARLAGAQAALQTVAASSSPCAWQRARLYL